MTGRHRGLDIDFQFPENWKVTEETNSQGVDAVSLESPQSAFLMLSRYAKDQEPELLVQQTIQAMQREYDDIEDEELTWDLIETDVVGRELQFYCLDLLVASRVMAFRWGPFTYLIQQQAEDREFEHLKPVFQAIMVSIFRSLGYELKPEELP